MSEKTGKSKRGRKKGVRNTPGRTEAVSLRLTPRTRYLAEIAARVQLRTLSSFIEWAVNESFRHVVIGDRPAIKALGELEHVRYPLKLADAANDMWQPDKSDRFLTLAILYPGLLDDNELVLWRLVQECDAVWHGTEAKEGAKWHFEHTAPDRLALRQYWERFEQVAAGKADESILPQRQFYEGVNGSPPTSKVIDPLEQTV